MPILLALAAGAAEPASGPSELDQVLRQLESRGKSFVNFSARFSQKKYTAVLKEFDAPESGIFVYARAADGSALLRQEVQKPAIRILTIKGGLATVHQPALRQAQVVNLGKNKDKAEFLALGLGQSPAKLRETFDLEYRGTEDIQGARTSVLALRPRHASAAAYFSSITLWIAKASGLPIRQRLEEPSGDYLLVSFADVKVNTKIAESSFVQRLPAGTDVQTLR